MRKFAIEFTDEEERYGIDIFVKACTLTGALKRGFKKWRKSGLDKTYPFYYQIRTRRKGCSLWQPIHDFFNGTL